MMFSNVIVWVLLFALAVGAGILGGALLLYWHARRQLMQSTKYLLDRLNVVDSDIKRMREDFTVLATYLSQKGLLDEDDLAILHRQLIEIPQRLEAEKNELLKEAVKSCEEARIVRNIPDTFH